MKIIYSLFITILITSHLIGNKYYTYDRIDSTLHEWQESYGYSNHPGFSDYGIIYNLDTIGYSSLDSLPIFAVKISDNADKTEDEIGVLILGQCHAEEIYGVEISMAIIECFINPNSCFQNNLINNDLKLKYLPLSLENIELWVVPTHNPEGLKVVHGYINADGVEIKDPSYRKNKRDANFNNTFLENIDWQYGVGHDKDGVDLNRNYDINWIFGHDYLDGHPGSCAIGKGYNDYFDYYRGSKPFSENETIAIKEFVLKNQFLLSIAYHSSRSGCVAERVVFPWGWKDKGNAEDHRKLSPDYTIIEYIANELTDILNFPQEDGIPQGGRYGNAHDWIYRETGAIQFLIEVGGFDYGVDGLSDDSLLILDDEDTIDRNLAAFFYIMMISAGARDISIPDEDNVKMDLSLLKGRVSDNNGNYISNAIIEILELQGSILKDRITDMNGRFNRILMPSSDYTLVVSAPGYISDTTNISDLKNGINEIDIQLLLQPKYELNFVIDAPLNSNQNVALYYKNSFDQGELSYRNLDLVKDMYNINILAEGLSPVIIQTILNEDREYNIQLLKENILFKDDFDNVSNWEIINGSWDIIEGVLKSQNDFFYNNNTLSQIKSRALNFTEGMNYVLKIKLKNELEWDHDYFSIIYISDNHQDTLLELTGDHFNFHEKYIPIKILEGQGHGYFMLNIKTDYNLNYRGVEVEEFIVYNSGQFSSKSLINNNILLPQNFVLDQNYPNPFNPKTKINFSLPYKSSVSISIFDIKGQFIENILDDTYHSGSYVVNFNADSYASGVYLYRMKTDKLIQTKKFIIIK